MGKVLALLLIIISAIGSVAGYLFLSDKINDGERRVADGQIRLEKGWSMLKEGKIKLETGKRKLLKGKNKYKKAKDNLFLVLTDNLIQDGKGFEDAKKRIAEGDKKVAIGERKVKEGERLLCAGELELCRGMKKLKLAKAARIACALGAAFFTSLSIILWLRWRQSFFGRNLTISSAPSGSVYANDIN